MGTSPSEWSTVLRTDVVLGINLVPVGGSGDPREGACEIGVSVKGHLRDFREVDYLPAIKAVFQKIN